MARSPFVGEGAPGRVLGVAVPNRTVGPPRRTRRPTSNRFFRVTVYCMVKSSSASKTCALLSCSLYHLDQSPSFMSAAAPAAPVAPPHWPRRGGSDTAGALLG